MAVCKALSYITAVVCAIVVTSCVGTFHLLNWMDTGTKLGLFNQNRSSAWSQYDLNIVIPYWIVNAWGATYVIQVMWMIYGLTLVCQRTVLGPLYVKPCLVPAFVYVTSIVAQIGIFVWLILWDKELLVMYSIFGLVVATLSLYLALGLTITADNYAAGVLAEIDADWLLRITRALVQNGLAAHVTWISVVTMYHSCVILMELTSLSAGVASLAFYGFYMMHLLTTFCFEACLLNYKMRSVYSHYGVYIMATVQIVYKNRLDESARFREMHLILAGLGLGLAVLCLIMKVSISVGRRHHKPTVMTPYRLPIGGGGGHSAVKLSPRKLQY